MFDRPVYTPSPHPITYIFSEQENPSTVLDTYTVGQAPS